MSCADSLMSTFAFRLVNKVTGHKLMSKITQKKLRNHRLSLLNQYECEAHRELILKGLEASPE